MAGFTYVADPDGRARHSLAPEPRRIDPFSPTWLFLEAHIKSDIEAIRDMLEYPQPELRSSELRGQLTSLRNLLQLGASDPG
jgi:hypothetical protein